MSKGRRQRHAFIWSDGADHFLNILLCGNKSERIVGVKSGKKLEYEWGARGERHQLKLWWKPQIDERNRPLMEGLASGAMRLLKVSFVFERPGKKIFAMLTYEKEVSVTAAGGAEATLGPLEPDGSLWLRVDNGPRHNHTDFVHELIHKKDHFEGILKRLRARMRRSGSGHRQDYRRGLLRAGSFSRWASGRIHQASAKIVAQLVDANVGRVTIAPISLGELPMHELEEKLKYKLTERGIEIVRLDPKDKTTMQSLERMAAKRGKRIAQGKRGLRMLRETLDEERKGDTK
jgi:hypothetical protein